MGSIIQNFADYPAATLLCIGLLLLIGSITKGNIDLILFKIPPINKKQAAFLIVLGSLLILTGLIIAVKPWSKNHPPVANDEQLSCSIGDKKVIDVLKNDSDEDSDKLYLQIINASNSSSSLGDKIEYTAKKTGLDTILYQISDGRGGLDTAKVIIKVDPVFVNIKGQLTDIFGNPMNGKYNIAIAKEICSTPVDCIRARDDGIFELKNVQENEGCQILIEQQNIDFIWGTSDKTYAVIYDPIDSIQIIFCKGYNKSAKEPENIIRDIFNIRFDGLNEVKENYNGKKIKYGRLYFQVKFFGSDKDDYSNKKIKRELICIITQKNEDKIAYTPFTVIAGTNSNGWRSDFNKKLLKGEYGLQLMSKTGKQEVYLEFEIK